MEERFQQLQQITQMCLNDLKEAQENCERYSFNIQRVTKSFSSKRRDSSCFLTEFDSFLTNITSVMEAARKFYIHLNFCGEKLFEEKPKSKTEKIICGHIEKSRSHFFPAEEYDLSPEAHEDFIYPSLNLSHAYKPNDIINGTVTYVKNLKDLSFFILDYASQYRSTIVELTNCVELRQYHGLPEMNEIFGCVLDNLILRAVLSPKTFYDDEMNEEILPCYLLDTGEILPLKRDHVMYKLTNEQKKIPALALPSQLVTKNKNPFKDTVENKLNNIEYTNCKFKIIAIENDILKVDIIDNYDKETEQTFATNHAVENSPNKIQSNKANKMQLTEEELEVLYEEPLSTSNAMKAVMGYDPQDDKRICRFYNPSTGSCFKGINCKLEHTLRQPDGWTKDVLPTSSIVDSRHAITMFTPDSIINITPTYVGQLDRFFAQVNEPNKNVHPFVWNDEDVPSWKRFEKPPHMFELVLCRYVDDLWYRAKIMSHDDEYKCFKVFYVDYGNVQTVRLRDLAVIDTHMAALPFQAVLCRFENVNERSSLSTEERKNCIEILCDMILNKTMDVKVISHYEDLFISFVDKTTFPLPDVLVDMGFLDFNNKILL